MMTATQTQLVRGTVLPPSDWESPVSLRVCVCRKKKKNWSDTSSCHASKAQALLTITAVTNLA